MQNSNDGNVTRYIKTIGIGLLFIGFYSCDTPMDADQESPQEVSEPDFGTAEKQPAPERHIIGLEPGNAQVAREAADEVYRQLDFGDIGIAVSGKFPEAALQALENNPNVRYIEKEGTMQAHSHTVDEEDGDPSQQQVLPWGIDRVDADVAQHAGETAEGAKITIIDSGIDPNHETLEANVAGGKAWASCRGGQCSEDWDDDNDHGTHVAGTAGAVNNNIGVVGVATEADLYAAKVLDSRGSGSFTDVADAIVWSADEGHDVANLSLGGGSSDVVEDAVQYADAEGVLVIASAGNDSGGSVNYPAAYDEVMAVSATNDDDQIAGFSSVGPEVEITAPGASVLSSVPGDNYSSFNGTSMSAPHVAGAAAHLMTSMSNDDARAELKGTAEDIGLDENEQGAGLLDVAEALGVDEDDEEEEEEEEEIIVSVETSDASGVGETTATVNGNLEELDGTDAADVYFEWGESGNLSNSTSTQSLSSADSFDEELSNLSSGTEYEFRAVAEANGESDTGTTLSFTTDEEDDGDDPVDPSDPVIEEFDVTTRSSGPWARANVDWTVSDEDGDLDTVTSELLDSNGNILDSETTNISGSSASGEHEVRTRDNPAEVRLTVTDGAGNETSQTQDY